MEEYNDEINNIVSLLDGDTEYDFEVLDTFEYEDKVYYILIPLFDDINRGIEAGESYTIFEAITNDNDEIQFVEPEEDIIDELDKIVESYIDDMYKERLEAYDN